MLNAVSMKKRTAAETVGVLHQMGSSKNAKLKTNAAVAALFEDDGFINDDDVASFPTRNQQPTPGFPASYQKYQPQTDCRHNLLDVQYFYLNDFIFHNTTNSSVSVNLFQAGRKKNYGYIDNQFTTLYLPAKPDDLSNWLELFNRGASIKPAGVEEEGWNHYSWQSIVVLPRSKMTQQLQNKYRCNEKRGFTDAPIIEDISYYYCGTTTQVGDLDKMFPKIAALAGLKKDKYVPKGWISFTKCGGQCSLSICRGNAKEPKKSKSPKGLAFEGENQHTPVEPPMFQISGGLDDIRGLHDLFCVVEGLLKTLQ